MNSTKNLLHILKFLASDQKIYVTQVLYLLSTYFLEPPSKGIFEASWKCSAAELICLHMVLRLPIVWHRNSLSRGLEPLVVASVTVQWEWSADRATWLVHFLGLPTDDREVKARWLTKLWRCLGREKPSKSFREHDRLSERALTVRRRTKGESSHYPTWLESFFLKNDSFYRVSHVKVHNFDWLLQQCAPIFTKFSFWYAITIFIIEA